MNILKIEEQNIANGPGIRTVIWVAGCSHCCPGCHNPETWSYLKGHTLDTEMIEHIIDISDHDYISGITFTGGDPLSERNRWEVIDLAKLLREEFPDKSFWLWTGYTFEEISMIPGIDVFDVIIDGKFEIEKRDLTIPWRGSTNQRVIDVQKSLKENKIIKIME